MARRHRVVTVPSGLVLFACIALPAYRDCDHNRSMYEDPFAAGCCIIGLVVAIAAIASARRAAEFGLAIASLALTTLVALMLGWGATLVDGTYVGVRLGFAAAVALLAGTILWIVETRGRSVVYAATVTAIVALAFAGIVAIFSEWNPPTPPQHDYSKIFIVH